jgi:hypothetical protein
LEKKTCQIYIRASLPTAFFVCLFVCLSTEHGTQGLEFSRQELYHLSHTSSLFVCIFWFFRQDLANFTKAGLELAILQPLPPK